MLKFVAIDILETALTAVDQLQWGQKMVGSYNERVLFSGLFLNNREEALAFFRKAAARACEELYGNEEAPEKARLVNEIVNNRFGCNITMLVEGIFIFSPVYRYCGCTFTARSGSICDGCCHPDYYQPWLNSMKDSDAFLEAPQEVEIRYYNERSNDCCSNDDCCSNEEMCVN